jgi:nitrile hydratase subunit alpha
MTAVPRPHDHPDVALRAEALESLLLERGLIDPKVVDGLISRYETDVGPMNGARVIAKAWTDADYRRRLLEDGTAAIGELGYSGPQGEHIEVLENTDKVHNVVVCTLCSCYPWPVLGLPPSWYKDPAYRARIVREPRRLLAEMGSCSTTTSRSGCGTAARRSGTWCSPSARRKPRTCPRRSWLRS